LQVFVRENNVEQALRVLKKKMQREGIFREMKGRKAYEKPSERRTREKAEAIRRARKAARKQAQRDGLIPTLKRRDDTGARFGGRRRFASGEGGRENQEKRQLLPDMGPNSLMGRTRGMAQRAVSRILIGHYGLHAFVAVVACALSWVSLGVQLHDLLLRSSARAS
jgi:small subunit ribosomal protein S21